MTTTPQPPGQLELLLQGLPEGHELTWSEERQRAVFTTERVKANQERYQSILGAIAEGLGTLQIARAYRCSPNTVQAIRERDGASVEREKERISRMCMRAGRLSVERFIEAVESGEISPRDLSIGAGIFIEKGLLLAGEATSRTEVIEVSRDQVLQSLKRLRDGTVIDAEMVPSGALPPAQNDSPVVQPVVHNSEPIPQPSQHQGDATPTI